MALQGTISLENGFSSSEAHLVINKLTHNYIVNDEYVDVDILIYKDLKCFTDKKPEVFSLTHKCSGSDYITFFSESVLDKEGKTLLTQAYLWLKTLSQYSSWEKA